MLSQLLQSVNLFGTELTHSTVSKINEVGKMMKSNSLGNILSPTKDPPTFSESASDTSLSSVDPVAKLMEFRQTVKPQQNPPKVNFSKLASMTAPGGMQGTTTNTNIIKQAMGEKKARKVEMYAKLKPRAAVLFNDQLETESFVPGSDPLNFIEQDRKLGYQKPRVWFPTPQLDIAKDLHTTNMGSVNPIVEEFLKMKALASYVGDLLIPQKNSPYEFIGSQLGEFHNSQTIRNILPKKPTKGATNTGSKLLHVNKLKIKHSVDPMKYTSALKDAMSLWTPILKVHLPKYGKKREFSYIGSVGDNEEDGGRGSYDDDDRLHGGLIMTPRDFNLDAEPSSRIQSEDPGDDAGEEKPMNGMNMGMKIKMPQRMFYEESVGYAPDEQSISRKKPRYDNNSLYSSSNSQQTMYTLENFSEDVR
jgi:hypothetical protein